jgi:hypothetical protein
MLMRIFVTLLACAALGNAAAPTFFKDVLPVLQRNCQSCHRPGEAAPMALLTYPDSRPWSAGTPDSDQDKELAQRSVREDLR